METLYKYIVFPPDPSINPCPYWVEDGIIVNYDVSCYTLVSNTLVPLPGVVETTEAAYNAQVGSSLPPIAAAPASAYGRQVDSTILIDLGPSVNNVLPFAVGSSTVSGTEAIATGIKILAAGRYTLRAGVTSSFTGPGFGRLYLLINGVLSASADTFIDLGEVTKETFYVHSQTDLAANDEIETAFLYQGFDTSVVSYHELIVEKLP